MKPKKTVNLKYKRGDVVSHLSEPETIGLVIEAMTAWKAPDTIHFKRHLSGNQYQVYWSVCPPGDDDPVECWYPEEHLAIINKEQSP